VDKAAKTRWVEALRSGKYKQARGTLRDATGAMCCLGVLAEIEGVPRTRVNDTYVYDFDDCKCAVAVPASFHNLGMVEKLRLINMNDHQKKTFSEIADYIEEKL